MLKTGKKIRNSISYLERTRIPPGFIGFGTADSCEFSTGHSIFCGHNSAVNKPHSESPQRVGTQCPWGEPANDRLQRTASDRTGHLAGHRVLRLFNSHIKSYSHAGSLRPLSLSGTLVSQGSRIRPARRIVIHARQISARPHVFATCQSYEGSFIYCYSNRFSRRNVDH